MMTNLNYLAFRGRSRLQLLRATWRESLVCVMNDHLWGPTDVMITSGPLHLPPTERLYEALAATQQCARCARIRDVDVSDGTMHDAIAEARMDDLAIWDDPDARAAHLEMVDVAWEQEWLDGGR